MADAISQLPAFSFLWPAMLWLLPAVLALAAGYVWLDARRRRATRQMPSLAGMAARAGSGRAWRRHVGPVLTLLASAALIVALARPQAVLTLPSRIDTVVLVMDLSASMRAQDVKPSRLLAAQRAAKDLVDAQPAGVKIGVVSMAGTAALAQAPTRSKDDVIKSLDRLHAQTGTALGNGVLVALTTLLPETTTAAAMLMSEDAPPPSTRADGAIGGTSGGANDPDVRPGSYRAGAIVVFSDGGNNAGTSIAQAAQLAADNGVRVYAVGVGTPEGVVLKADGWSSRVRLEEAALRQIAEMTGAQYFRLDDSAAIRQVYRAIRATLAFGKHDQVEITAFFAALGALLAACAGLLSIWWFGRVL